MPEISGRVHKWGANVSYTKAEYTINDPDDFHMDDLNNPLKFCSLFAIDNKNGRIAKYGCKEIYNAEK